jgi:hypothetical protein
MVYVGDHIKISMDQVLEEQFRKFGFTDNEPSEDWLTDHMNELLVYRTDSLLVVFERMTLYRKDDSGRNKWYVEKADLRFVMEK